MKKTAKKINILGIMFIVISLVIVILLFGYFPNGKVVPSKVSYTIPSEVEKEISNKDDEVVTPIKVTYEINDDDINESKSSGSYNAGKSNPFASTESQINEDSKKSTGNNRR